MKKLLSIFLILTMLAPLAVIGNASAVPTISVGTAQGAPGETVTLNVDFLSNPGINSYSLTLGYDTEKFSLVSADASAEVGGDIEAGDNIVWLKSADTSYSGTFLTLTFKIADNAAPGDYPVSVSYKKGDICNYDEHDVDFATYSGVVTVEKKAEPRIGDIDGDGKVNVMDAVTIKRIILGKDENPEHIVSADIYVDGKVNVLDAQKLVGIIIGKNK